MRRRTPYLAKICKKVYLVHRRDSSRASKNYMDPLIDSGIEFVWNSRVTEIHGDKKVTGVTVASLDGPAKEISVRPYSLQSAGFLIHGAVPTVVDLDGTGYIIADETTKTNLPGVLPLAMSARNRCVQLLRLPPTAVASRFIENIFCLIQ